MCLKGRLKKSVKIFPSCKLFIVRLLLFFLIMSLSDMMYCHLKTEDKCWDDSVSDMIVQDNFILEPTQC